MYRVTAESVNKTSKEHLREIESGEVEPNRVLYPCFFHTRDWLQQQFDLRPLQ